MGEGFGLVREQKHDVARRGLRFEPLPAQAGAVHGVRILAAFQRVACTAPAEVPFWRSTTESRESEMRRPARVSISSASRGSVQFGRSATGPDKTSWATSRARSALRGAGPGATDFFSASIPPLMKALLQPERVSKIARARSAAPRSREWLRAISPCLFSSSAATADLPAMIPISITSEDGITPYIRGPASAILLSKQDGSESCGRRGNAPFEA